MTTLYVVATPIGNLEDLSPRAANVLRTVAVVFAEDTRRSRILMTHVGKTETPIRRLDANVSPEDVAALLSRVEGDDAVAVVTDAGTPAVSDPGSTVVAIARERGFTIVPIPGPSAVVTALSACGYALVGFSFVGFLPRAGVERARALTRVEAAEDAVVFFESPNRIAATLEELASRQPSRRAFVARELTKLHEEHLEGPLGELASRAKQREWLGELTIVLAPHTSKSEKLSEEDVQRRIDEALDAGTRPRDISEQLAFDTGWSKRDLYQLVLARKSSRP